jgi:hypothetical protein
MIQQGLARPVIRHVMLFHGGTGAETYIDVSDARSTVVCNATLVEVVWIYATNILVNGAKKVVPAKLNVTTSARNPAGPAAKASAVPRTNHNVTASFPLHKNLDVARRTRHSLRELTGGTAAPRVNKHLVTEDVATMQIARPAWVASARPAAATQKCCNGECCAKVWTKETHTAINESCPSVADCYEPGVGCDGTIVTQQQSYDSCLNVGVGLGEHCECNDGMQVVGKEIYVPGRLGLVPDAFVCS